ncbi:helix-hairpin-helix domain-containing protein [Blastopirellula sp. J2-11]|uniref:Holliday junction branch migration protein RuvA n=1 Tax=Blastopirellula sp. J2-11 TaxID=2943192 RepID=UPI0021CA8DBD|nr:Holliday junction branch migration protein RuvA [Blastopirellula sp. J2-11]UUO07982.1 helix-hairpin-helix domain-containing protein [Blastopirellula sp. J2-11]
MITKITGKVTSVSETALSLTVGAFEYEVLIPEFVRRQLQNHIGEDVVLHTIEYLEGNPQQGRLTPRMIGFSDRIEREFFELFCSVDGVGVRKALRAMVRPVQEVASLIEEQDTKGLSALPGVGPATADRIVAKLRRKVPKFALLVGRSDIGDDIAPRDVISETFDVLRSLGHSESDARKLIDAALEEKKKYKDVESLLQAVYQLSHSS